jgi:hypothetical protein
MAKDEFKNLGFSEERMETLEKTDGPGGIDLKSASPREK